MLFDPVIDGGMGHACCCTESTRVTGGQCESTGRLLKKTHCQVGDSMPRGTKDGGGGIHKHKHEHKHKLLHANWCRRDSAASELMGRTRFGRPVDGKRGYGTWGKKERGAARVEVNAAAEH